MTTNGIARGFTKGALDHYEAMLLERRRLLMSDVQALEDAEVQVDTVMSTSTHLADLGSDRAASDVSLGRLESESTEIQQIDESLERIRDGSFGVCETCERTLSKARLEAIPYARLCLSCKEQEER